MVNRMGKWAQVGVVLCSTSLILASCNWLESSENQEQKKVNAKAISTQTQKQQQFATGKAERKQGPITKEEKIQLGKLEKDHVIYHGPKDQRVVALTFDDGPHPKYTQKILDILHKENVKATFFLIGKNVQYYPELVEKEIKEGHVVASHSWAHRFFSNMGMENAKEDLEKTRAEIKKATKKNVLLFRPPYGAIKGMEEEVKKAGFVVINWDVDTNDWRPGRTPQQILQVIKKQVQPGSIILQHDGGGNRTATVQALPKVIKYLKEQGYRFVTVDELLGIRPYTN
ncbi:polysaccharide deacetylase family protein [Thermoflavimicrobium dichotomicum]|uniref:Peptidoglycan/xylan/chitin deacetylase, PgdA/CDA1 family n=1 Tax=Thermoflavimicrobium dichotomicum TaxID=46223 RepID=A0A1I3QRC5_9BACL|nr:polysaccharide deacetylase family protein [Thermoflavimicrobium dichotomicum]SFJ36694.1 Peptidoglycan/xylan/chitin deacetylase, PgdA/CDA1 family [Thermoflavimicrobium dichotomicum]